MVELRSGVPDGPVGKLSKANELPATDIRVATAIDLPKITACLPGWPSWTASAWGNQAAHPGPGTALLRLSPFATSTGRPRPAKSSSLTLCGSPDGPRPNSARRMEIGRQGQGAAFVGGVHQPIQPLGGIG